MLLCEQKAQSKLCRIGTLWALSLFSSCALSVTGQATVITHAPPSVPSLSAGSVSHEKSATALQALSAKGVKPHYLFEITALYAKHPTQLLWADERAVVQLQQQLAEVALSGVQPQFTQWVTWLTDASIKGMERDIILSDAMLGYLQFVDGVERNGTDWLYSSVPYRLQPPSAGRIEQWQQSIATGNSLGFVTSLAPRHSQYAKMHQALRSLLADTRPWPVLTMTESLRPEQQSQDLGVLREILQRNGMLVGPENITLFNEQTATPDNRVPTADIYTGELVEAVKRFQQWQGLDADGVIGKRTRDWLSVSPQTRAALLALNIQRLRLVPDNVTTGIMVNIPDYSLNYYQNGTQRLSSRVIVGQPKRKTPLMSSSLYNVVVNPPWNVPTTLIRQDIVPKVIKDPSYLQRNNYTLLSGWHSEAETIDPSMIDWSVVSADRFPYRIRQAPGANNSLGRYKFNMPNSEAIYLHDTPNHGLFQRDIRALSSGCVRVNKASELAGLLLQDAGWNDARISSTLAQGNTTYVPVKQRIPVNLYYLTAWVADDGKPQFRTDIYNYDDTVKRGAGILGIAGQLLQ